MPVTRRRIPKTHWGRAMTPDVEAETGRRLADDGRRLLGECKLFRGLGADERHTLLARSRIRNFAAGETIFLMGSPGDNMMAVLRGNVRISLSSSDGRELLLAILFPGEFFGEISLLDGKERTADATAATACSLAILDRREVLTFFERYPSAWLNIVSVLCHRLRKTDEHIAEVALLQLPARLARALLRALATGDTPPEAAGRKTEPIQLSQGDLGKLVGAARESVNRCLRTWQQAGIIAIKGGLIVVNDRAALEELAEPG
jgi:CRP/FNR family cyclic AMP-dependent transcriptional regulator